MPALSAGDGKSKGAPMPPTTPVVFVVDDDVSVRESLESLIRWAGWKPRTSARHRTSCPVPETKCPVVWCWMWNSPT